MEDKPQRATSYDVARLAGVSQSAVSRCFKPGASISAKMREKVMKAAKELGYQPNAIARSLITKRSGLVAILVSSTMNFYYPEVLFQLTQRLSNQGLRVLLFTVDSESDADAVMDQIWQYSVDGVISASHLSRSQYELLTDRDIPVILFNRWFADRKTDTVWADSTSAAGELIDDLVTMGHSRFGLILGPETSMVGQNRVQQIEQALSRHKLSPVALHRGDYRYGSGAAAAEPLMKQSPTVIIGINDMMAMGAMDQLRHELGLQVPKDISVAGFDGIAAGQFSAYKLTTIRQPIARMASAAVDLLLERVERRDMTVEQRNLACILIQGESTADAAKAG
ncbi:MAG: LacI family DNA-binding transcriptional regulator [Pseudomonadota bacterium]